MLRIIGLRSTFWAFYWVLHETVMSSICLCWDSLWGFVSVRLFFGRSSLHLFIGSFDPLGSYIRIELFKSSFGQDVDLFVNVNELIYTFLFFLHITSILDYLFPCNARFFILLTSYTWYHDLLFVTKCIKIISALSSLVCDWCSWDCGRKHKHLSNLHRSMTFRALYLVYFS